MAIIIISNLTKKFKNKKALDDINIEFLPGKIYGIFGNNGAGKTTLLDSIAHLLIPTTGEILVDDHKLGKHSKEKISFMIASGFELSRVKDFIFWYEYFFEDFDSDEALLMLKKYDISLKERVSELSKGTQEKLSVILAISRKTEVYIFDEPLTGVDPVDRIEILDLILSKSTPETTIILSTHLISETERIIDTAVFMKEGKIILNKETDEIRDETGLSIDQYYKELYKKC
ncbi:ABC transporter, ATP-binding protein [Alteracholeplasma palmae J233]|uniref:ABC transporter, ATP-binding protein n=1 Tax=Alteracholeplasma palmae (strain ATCC 49389 / J233) TaxID=1318466 RepID=U4KRZ2_ALTPJ|nr:ABC transporter ATP-binding protein [Alteracholeplasma palmae]CCV64571.1 ABC transporter, ATP-binding protein [Alteracholeplasma palmae J233]